MKSKNLFNTRKAGFAIAIIGVLAGGPDAAYLRAQQEAGGSTTVIGVWRYCSLAVCNVVVGAYFGGGIRNFLAGVSHSFWPVLCASTIIVFINAGMCISLLTVEPAFALLLMSLSPLWAAVLGKLLLGDVLPRRTIIAQGFSLVSTVVVFVPSLRKMIAPAKHGQQHELWQPIEIVPLATGFAVAMLLTYNRWQVGASLEAAPAVGAALTALAAAFVMLVVEQQPASLLVEGLDPSFWFALLLMAAGCAMYDGALVIAPRSLQSAEVALVLLAETILGPLCVWLVFGDAPGAWTLAGGALLLLTLVGHELAGMRAGGDGEQLFEATSAGVHRSPRLGLSPKASPMLDRLRTPSPTPFTEDVMMMDNVRVITYVPPNVTQVVEV